MQKVSKEYKASMKDSLRERAWFMAELIQQVQYADGWYLCFREKTEQEMRYAELTGKLEYMAMMTGVDMEV